MRLLSTILLWSLVCSLSLAKPIPPSLKDKEKPKKEAAATLQICGWTNWGAFSQEGQRLSILGDTWGAVGEIMKDGRIKLQWVLLSDGRVGWSVYDLQRDGSLTGQWGWEDQCEILPNGNIVGDVREDRIYRVTPPKAEGPDL